MSHNTSGLAASLQDYEVLVLPGWRNSGPTHWQSHWERLFPEFRRVEQRDWVQPKRGEWVAALDAAVTAARKPVLILAHSLGCVTVAHWAALHDSSKVAAVLLVAPADVERATVASSLRSFAPIPRLPLPFPSLLVASDNDPCCQAWRASELAADWQSGFRLLSGLGHINADSQLGDWDTGLELLEALPHLQHNRYAA
jgi:predicted alpha/beta hydrolase family esterase